MQNKADRYRTMLVYLSDLGADVSGHDDAPLTRTASAELDDMGPNDLMHYQRVLEATIDNRSPLMDKMALREEYSEVVRERLFRGDVEDKVEQAREFRSRVASLG